MAKKQMTTSKTLQYFACDLAKGLFTGMVANYLVYIMLPKAGNLSMTPLLPESKFLGFLTVLSIITLISKLVDAFSDPIVANLSDKSKNPRGRRIPLMQWSAIPYALCCCAIFFAPFAEKSVGNAVWVGIFMVLYFIFYTIYSIPQRALVPEIIPDEKQRVTAYTISTIFFMGGSGIAYTAEFLVSFIVKSGMAEIWAWRIIFGIFTLIGISLLLLSAFCMKEKDYVNDTKIPNENFFKSFKIVVKNKQFMIATFADLFNYIAMAFFQSTMFIYLSDLLNLQSGQSMFVLIPAIATAMLFFPIIVKVAKTKSKKIPLLVASALFTVLFGVIYFGDIISQTVSPLVAGIGMGLIIAYPFAAINIIPQTIIADIIQEDTLRTGANREGIFSAAKTFLEKVAYAVAWLLVPIILSIGSNDFGAARTLFGIKLTGPIAAFFSLISFVIMLFYDEKNVMKSLRSLRMKQKIENGEIVSPELMLQTSDANNETINLLANVSEEENEF